MEFDLNHHPRFYIQFNVWFNLLLKMSKIDLSFHLVEYLLLVTRLNQIIRTNHFFVRQILMKVTFSIRKYKILP